VIKSKIFRDQKSISHYFFNRLGGNSKGIYKSLNCGKGSKDKINFVEQNFSNTRKSVLRITYTLTDDVTGSLFYEYRENDTRLTGRRIDRDFGINLNVAIRG
jgi:hypothetical protein